MSGEQDLSDLESGWTSTDLGGVVSTDLGGDVGDPQEALEAQADGVVASLSELEELRPEVWSQLEQPERLEVLQDVESRAAEVQGRPAVPITSREMEPGCFGGYARGEGIALSEEHLMSDDIGEITDTVIHEGRHAYQDHAIQNPGFAPDEGLVATWRENWDSYLSAEEYGQELYESQPIEADAWGYSQRIRSALFETGE